MELRRWRQPQLGCATTFAVAAVVLCAVLPVAVAWDKDGHEAIGMVTMSALQGKPTAQVKRLMHGRDAVDVAAWAHKVNKKYPWTAELHYQKQPYMKCKGASLDNCTDNKCLVRALKHFYGRLVHKDLVDLKWPKGLTLTDADCVKFLINLVGDLHQPMHFGFADDDLGRNVTVEFRGKKMSLYDLWDTHLTQAIIADQPGFWWGGWTHVRRITVEYEMDGDKWKKDGVAMFDKWADENAQFTCDKVYAGLDSQIKAGTLKVDEQLFEKWKRELMIRILIAGARTAIVLNSILQGRESLDLKGGTAVSELEGEEPEVPKSTAKGSKAEIPHGSKPQHGPLAGAANAGIGVLVLFVFLVLMRLLHGPDNTTAKAKARESGKKS